MKPSLSTPSSKHPSDLMVGLFSKSEAAHWISKGIQHFHSSLLLAADPCVQITQRKLAGERLAYPWEKLTENKTQTIGSSIERKSVLHQITASLSFSKRSQNRERLEMVLEELTTNALYHSRKDPQGNDFYSRRQEVILEQGKSISVEYGENREGILISVSDFGGSLRFADVSQRIVRNQNELASEPHFDSKDSGAGLGMKMVFEVSTHIQVYVKVLSFTRVSVWLSRNEHFDPDFFSFNFFKE